MQKRSAWRSEHQSCGAAVVVVGARGVGGGLPDEACVERERVGVGGVGEDGALAVLLGARGVGLDVPEEPGVVAEQQRVGRVGVDHAAVVRVGRGAAVAAVLPPGAAALATYPAYWSSSSWTDEDAERRGVGARSQPWRPSSLLTTAGRVAMGAARSPSDIARRSAAPCLAADGEVS
jgi:hypothetical protein